jgi:uncharacterized membrane protein YdjX (TVP38/TMEM64 family)
MIKAGGWLAPLAFIFFHLVRQFLFIPVPVVCIAGGVLFGTVWGTLYSLVGLIAASLLFFVLIKRMPNTRNRLSNIRKRWFGEYRKLTVGQIAVLRLIPFVHYQLLNFCLFERTKNMQSYLKGSLLTIIPLAFFYTVFGEFIATFTPTMIVIILFALSVLVYLLREKMTVIKWREFFKTVHEG